MTIEPVSVASVGREILTLLGQNLGPDTARVEINVPEGMHVAADFGRLEQILLNLVTNSIHAIRKAVTDGRPSGHVLEIHAEKRGRKVALEVRDTGCGIEPQNMRKLFQPFFTTKGVGEGTGLGLPIVAQLVKEIKGEISVQSKVNEGTTVMLLLDPAQAPPSG